MSVQKKRNRNIPTKTSINLAMRERNTADVRVLIIGCLLIAVLAAAVAKFGVIDQYARLSAVAGQYNAVHNSYESMNAALRDYDQVETEYRTHSMDWLETDAQVDRQELLDLVERQLMFRGTVTRMAVYNDVMQVQMSGMTLAQISELILCLQEEPIVARAELELAETYDQSEAGALLSFSLTIVLQPGEEVAQ